MRRLPLVVLVLVFLAPAAASAAGAGTTQLVSRPDGFGPVPEASDNDSTTPGAISANGRFALFASDADGLAPGANSRVQNVYLRDRQAKTTTLVSRSDGLAGAGVDSDARNPAIIFTKAEHVLVAFESGATNMTDHETGVVANPRRTAQIWLRDVTDGTTVLVSRADGLQGAPADDPARRPAITDSAGGPIVAFDSQATNLRGTGVFIRTIAAHSTQQVSCRNSRCDEPGSSLSSDADIAVVPVRPGTMCPPPANLIPCVLVAFVTSDNSIVGAVTDQIVVGTATAPLASGLHPTPFDHHNGISLAPGGSLGNAASTAPAFSGDGAAVGFLSRATNLVTGAPAGVQEAYVRRLPGGPTQLVSRAPADTPADRDVTAQDLGGVVSGTQIAGLRVVFQTGATNLGGDGRQTYVRDTTASTTALLNRASGPGGAAGDGPSDAPPAITADGASALFTSASSNLVVGRASRFTSVYTRELTGVDQAVDLVSRPSGDGPVAAAGSDESSFDPASRVVSANGRFVAFDWQSDALSDVDDDRLTNVFVRDTQTGRTTLVSRATGPRGIAAGEDSFVAGISDDGHRVLFNTGARGLDPDANGKLQGYVRDVEAGTTTLVTRASGTSGAVAAGGAFAQGISADGSAVVITSLDALDPAGNNDTVHAYVRDLAAATTTLADRDDGAGGAVSKSLVESAAINADGTRVAFVSAATFADAPRATMQSFLYLRDLTAGTTELVSRADGAKGEAASASGTPAIDAAGDVVAFESTSATLGAGADAPQVSVRDVERGRTELVSRAVGGGTALPSEARSPSLDASGDRVAFVAFGQIESPPTSDFGAYVRDRGEQTTTLVSRADGAGGAAADADVDSASISASGDCIAFAGRFSNLGDGFSSADFSSVHLRTLTGECPGAATTAPPDAPDGPDAPVEPSGPDGPGPAGDPPGTLTPVISALRLSPTRFRVSGRRHGTTVRFTLSTAARVTLGFERLVPGHRKGQRCVAKGRGKRCTRVVRAGSLTVMGRAGANRVAFSGRLKRKALSAGSYRLTATPRGGRPRSVRFTVASVRRR